MAFKGFELVFLACSDLDPQAFFTLDELYRSNFVSSSGTNQSETVNATDIDQLLLELDNKTTKPEKQDNFDLDLDVSVDFDNDISCDLSYPQNDISTYEDDFFLDLSHFDLLKASSKDENNILAVLSSEFESHCESALSLAGNNLSCSDSSSSPLDGVKNALLYTPPDDTQDSTNEMSRTLVEFIKKENNSCISVSSKSIVDYKSSHVTHGDRCEALRRPLVKTGPHETRNKLKRSYQDEGPDYVERGPKPYGSFLKPIPKRFKSSGFITLDNSTTQCLDVDLNYHGYAGNVQKIIINHDITNFAHQEHDVNSRRSLMLESVTRTYEVTEEETNWGETNEHISFESGVLQRKIYVRDISEISEMVSLVFYEASPKFNENIPYEPQYFRYELDEYNNIVGESKCGLCAFCPEVKFYPFKNSSYLSHMTLMHGVFANNYVVPEGLYVGKYKLNRTSYSRKKNVVEGLQCPVCFETIPIKCWKTKDNPLLSYFRHFKKLHQKESRSFIDSVIDPVRFELL